MRHAKPSPMQRLNTGSPRRLSSRLPGRWRPFARVFVACGIVSLTLVLVACGAATTDNPTKQADATTQPSDALPHFSDWRVAYLGSDGNVHAVSLDGKTDVAGPALPDLNPRAYGTVLTSESVSPNGHMIAYDAMGGVDVVNLVTGRVSNIQAFPYGLFWSPDSRQLAVDEGNGSLVIANALTGDLQVIHGLPANVVGEALGWMDQNHLAVTDIQNLSWVLAPDGDQINTDVTVASLDIATGQVHVIAAIRNPDLACQRETLSPDGRLALVSNAECRGLPFTPVVDEIDLATGGVTPLPSIAQATSTDFTSVAWQAGTDRVAVVSDDGVYGGRQIWLLTLGQDRAQPLAVPLPLTHDVAGWAPGANTLVLTTGYQIGIGSGPFTLYALDVSANGQAEAFRSLTGGAMTFPFLGFVRN